MKILLLSDTHGQIAPSVLQQVSQCDLCIHAGDIGSASVLTELQSTGVSVVPVLGNNDVPGKWHPRELSLLKSIPNSQCIELPGGVLCVEHGHRVNPVKDRHAKLRKKYTTAKAVVYGHSHRLVVDDSQLPWILNPGAAGNARTYGGPSCLILTITTHQRWRIAEYRYKPV